MANGIEIGFLAAGRPDEPLGASDIRALEATGCASLWSAGHVLAGKPVPEAMMGLARLAACTERVTVGTAVLLLPLYEPVIVAKQVAELDRASNGRIVLGVGVGGEYPEEFAACGVPIEERGARTDRAIDGLRSWWSGGVTPWVDPPPRQTGGPPIVVAGRKGPAMRRAARRGDGWMPFLVSPRAYAASVEAITTEASAIGRSLDAFRWMCFVYTRIDDDPAVARRHALAFIGDGQAGAGARFEPILDRIAAVGAPDVVAARLQSFIDTGARHLVIACCATHDLVEQSQRVMSEVVPLLAAPRPEHAHAGH